MATTTVSNLPADSAVHSNDLVYLSHYVSPGVYTSAKATVQELISTVAPLTTKGDLLTFTTLNARLGVGTAGQFLRVNAATASGLEWQTVTTTDIAEGTNLYFTDSRVRLTPLTGLSLVNAAITATDNVLAAFGKAQGQLNSLVTGVSSVFGRTGAVIAVSGDYTTDLVTEATNLYFTDSRALTAVGKTNNATGWTIAGGTISKSLVVAEDCTINQNLITTADVLFSSIEARKDVTGTSYQLLLRGLSNLNKQLIGAYDSTNNVGWFQSVFQTSSFTPLILQPDGSVLGIGYLRNDTLPGELLAVKGSARTTDYFAQSEIAEASVTTPASGYKLFANSNDNGHPYVRDKTGTLYDLISGIADGLWSQVTNIVHPKDSLGVKSVQIKSLAQTENVRFTHEGTYVGYDASSPSQYHRFWQAIQAETTIQLNNGAGTLSALTGIGFYGGDTNYRMGFDDTGGTGYIRINAPTASAVYGFRVTAGSLAANNTVFSVDGAGQARVFSEGAVTQLILSGSVGGSPSKQLTFSYNTVASTATITSIWQGNTYTPLFLDASIINFNSAAVTYASIDSTGLKINDISEFTASNGITLKNRTRITLDGLVGSTEQLVIRGATNNNKQLLLGFDTASNYGQITSIIQGTGHVPFYLDASTVGFKVSGTVIASVNSSGFLVQVDNPTITLQGVTNSTKTFNLGYNTTSNFAFLQAVDVGTSFTTMSYIAQGHDFQVGVGTTSSLMSLTTSGLNINTINEFTASAGIRLSSKVSIGSTVAPTARLTGFDSTFLGISAGTYGTSPLVADQMEIYCDETTPPGNWTLVFVRKGADGTTVKTGSMVMI